MGTEVITLDEERKQRARMLRGEGHKQGTFARDGDLSLVEQKERARTRRSARH